MDIGKLGTLSVRKAHGAGLPSLQPERQLTIYSNTENLVLWARSKKIGCVEVICRGMMEYWSDEMLGLVE